MRSNVYLPHSTTLRLHLSPHVILCQRECFDSSITHHFDSYRTPVVETKPVNDACHWPHKLVIAVVHEREGKARPPSLCSEKYGLATHKVCSTRSPSLEVVDRKVSRVVGSCARKVRRRPSSLKPPEVVDMLRSQDFKKDPEPEPEPWLRVRTNELMRQGLGYPKPLTGKHVRTTPFGHLCLLSGLSAGLKKQKERVNIKPDPLRIASRVSLF